jgi:hypothetical protein
VMFGLMNEPHDGNAESVSRFAKIANEDQFLT